MELDHDGTLAHGGRKARNGARAFLAGIHETCTLVGGACSQLERRQCRWRG